MSSAATPEFDEAPQLPVKKKISLKTSRAREKEKELSQKKEQRAKTPPPVDERVAHSAMRHFVAAQLHHFGFSSASTPLLDEIGRCTVHLFTQVYSVALQYANVSFRTDANVYDVVAACEEAGIDIHALRKVAGRKRKPNSSIAKAPLPLLPPHAPPALPVFLPSDSSEDEANNKDELNKSKRSKAGKTATGIDTSLVGSAAGTHQRKSNKKGVAIPRSLRDIPKHLPNLPPKHTYLRTAPPAAPTRTLDSLEQRYQNSLLVQESLRTLVQGTEDPVPEPTILPTLPNGALVVPAPTPILQPSQQAADNVNGNGNVVMINGINKEKAPPTLEEVGMGGLVNCEAAERTANGTKRRRWKL